MAGASLLALLDDIASMLDDISAMTKVTAGKTTGLLGDDLAVNANQLTGLRAERELPVVWAVAKGSILNKCILLPLAFLISAFIPWLIQPLLMLGGAFLCYEGAEKVWHWILHRQDAHTARHKAQTMRQLHVTREELLAFEKKKIKGAIRTDFILSAEIIVISLGLVQGMDLIGSIIVVVLVAFMMTAGVYSAVAAIVKLDDVGMYLIESAEKTAGVVSFRERLGQGILRICPWLMKTLTVVGTLAMFLVGGGILFHGVPAFSHGIEHWLHELIHQGWLSQLGVISLQLLLGLVVGSLLVWVLSFFIKDDEHEAA